MLTFNLGFGGAVLAFLGRVFESSALDAVRPGFFFPTGMNSGDESRS